MKKVLPEKTDEKNFAEVTDLSPFLAACLCQPVKHVPVWYMRQAGRCLPEYRALKEKYDMLTLARTPELATEISLMPVRRFGVNAAILFADIMLPLIGMGVDLKIVENVGPVIAKPIRNINDVARLQPLTMESDFDYLKKTIGILRAELAGADLAGNKLAGNKSVGGKLTGIKSIEKEIPLIGFSGAPFTLASYLIEGKPSRDFSETKRLMHSQPETWHALMRTLTEAIIFYLELQISAGIQAVQLFDSWAGCLSKEDYATLVLPYSQEIFGALKSSKKEKEKIPRIHFGTNTAHFLEEFSAVECEVIGIDWRLPLAEAWKKIAGGDKIGDNKIISKKICTSKAIQGNLDPALLLCDFSIIRKKVDELFASIEQAGLDPKRGWIFNLGHGVLPDTPYENLIQLTDYVHSK